MRVKIIYIILLLLVSQLYISCTKDSGESKGKQFNSFIKKTSDGIYLNGMNTLVYDEALHQIAVSQTGVTYRIQDDIQSTFFHAKLSSLPSSEGEAVSVQFTTRGLSNIEDESYQMELEKQSGKTLWLWNKSLQLGIIITL